MRACSNGRRGNDLKLKDGIFTLSVRNKSFTLRVVRHWNKLPRKFVDAPSMEVLNVRLVGSLGNLVEWEVPCPWQEVWNQMIFKVLSNPII